MTRTQRMDAIRATVTDLAQAHVTVAFCLGQLQELLVFDEIDPSIGEIQLPRVDEAAFLVLWHGRACYLGNTKLFHLFARLLHRADRFVAHDHLLRDVWAGDIRSPDTIRSAVRQLKQKLRDADMADLAHAIRGQGGHYALVLREVWSS